MRIQETAFVLENLQTNLCTSELGNPRHATSLLGLLRYNVWLGLAVAFASGHTLLLVWLPLVTASRASLMFLNCFADSTRQRTNLTTEKFRLLIYLALAGRMFD